MPSIEHITTLVARVFRSHQDRNWTAEQAASLDPTGENLGNPALQERARPMFKQSHPTFSLGFLAAGRLIGCDGMFGAGG
jgi:hypothetical protein